MMIFLLYFLSNAFAERIAVGVSVGPQQVVASYHRNVWKDVVFGAHIGGVRFFEKSCVSDYKGTDAIAPTFSCERVEKRGAHLGLETLFEVSLPDFMDQYPVATIGPYLGAGYYQEGFFGRYGFVVDIRMDWEPLDVGIRTSIEQHGVEGTVYGAGVFAILHLSKTNEEKNKLY